jgi:hypothetical protein
MSEIHTTIRVTIRMRTNVIHGSALPIQSADG